MVKSLAIIEAIALGKLKKFPPSRKHMIIRKMG